ncbi:MAG: YkgJ family cysteine cluster protein [Polyangiaceae bacterium]
MLAELERDETLRALLGSGTPSEPLIELGRRVYLEALSLIAANREQEALERAIELAETCVEQIGEQRRRLNVVVPPLACARGCSHCCTLRVEIGPLEAQRLLPVVERRRQQEALRALGAELGGLSRQQRVGLGRACVFLEADGACGAHAQRPFACRAANSRSADACRAALRHGDALGSIPVDPVPLGLIRSAAIGFGLACADAGLQSELRELHDALSQALAPRQTPEIAS